MRKWKNYLGILMLGAVVISAAGCQTVTQNTTEDSTTKTESTDKKAAESDKSKTSGTESTKKEDTAAGTEDKKEETVVQPEASLDKKEPETQAQSKVISLYIPNDNADGYDKKEAELSPLSPEGVMGQLISAGAIKDGISVQSFEETENEGQKVLNLDLSSGFKEYLMSMGTAGERMAMGAVVNTYLEAYGASGVKITVDGSELETGHAVYSGYQSYMEN